MAAHLAVVHRVGRLRVRQEGCQLKGEQCGQSSFEGMLAPQRQVLSLYLARRRYETVENSSAKSGDEDNGLSVEGIGTSVEYSGPLLTGRILLAHYLVYALPA